jgi:hypothetical protein
MDLACRRAARPPLASMEPMGQRGGQSKSRDQRDEADARAFCRAVRAGRSAETFGSIPDSRPVRASGSPASRVGELDTRLDRCIYSHP